jgi:hypothetical protein
MNSLQRNALIALISLALLSAFGCAGKAETRHSGFLDNYPKFEEGTDDIDLVWKKKAVNFGRYDKVMMDRVVFYFSDQSDYQGIDPDELKELADLFHKAMAEALQDKYPFVDTPAPDVLRLRFAITEVEQSRPALNAVTTVLPIGLGISLIKKGATGEHTNVGGASMELEGIDSMTNERVFAAIDKEPGAKLEGFSKWGAAEEAFEFWAKRLRKGLDEAHGIKTE